MLKKWFYLQVLTGLVNYKYLETKDRSSTYPERTYEKYLDAMAKFKATEVDSGDDTDEDELPNEKL